MIFTQTRKCNEIILFCSVCVIAFVSCVWGLSYRKEQETIRINEREANNVDKCDQSRIPVMDSFNFKKFCGDWYEVSKTVSGYIDVDDGMWRISVKHDENDQGQFLFSGRDNNQHCIRAIQGKVTSSVEPPGKLSLAYQTYSTRVKETVRVLFTDYNTLAVVYTCMSINMHTGACHEAGIYGAIWSRAMHIDAQLYTTALKYLEAACVHKDTLRVRNVVGPCNVDDIGYRDDEFPAPDFCYQPLNLGSCQANVQRFYYDPQEQNCKNFTYGGCQGNENNFMSLKDCELQCISVSKREPVCMSEAMCGVHCPPCCRESKTGCVECDCETIIVDHFFNCLASPTMCRSDCVSEEKYPGCYICDCGETELTSEDVAICEEVKNVGKCAEELERYYYDAISESCEKFFYTGCKGNNNNFLTLEDCEERCQARPKPHIVLAESTDSATVKSMNIFLIFVVVMMQLYSIM